METTKSKAKENGGVSRRNFIAKTILSGNGSRRCAMKVCSSSEAATSCITCAPIRWGRHDNEPFDCAVRFERRVRELLLAGEDEPLINYDALGRDAVLSVPTPDHYLPLLYILALREDGEPVSFPVEGVDGGSVSMLTIRIG